MGGADWWFGLLGRPGPGSGFGRWPGSMPTMITFPRGVTSGYLPLGGVVVSDEVAAPFWDPDAGPFRHGATYAGHPTCRAAAIANIRLLEDEGCLLYTSDAADERSRADLGGRRNIKKKNNKKKKKKDTER